MGKITHGGASQFFLFARYSYYKDNKIREDEMRGTAGGQTAQRSLGMLGTVLLFPYVFMM
jgi:hypothetical protein